MSGEVACDQEYMSSVSATVTTVVTVGRFGILSNDFYTNKLYSGSDIKVEFCMATLMQNPLSSSICNVPIHEVNAGASRLFIR